MVSTGSAQDKSIPEFIALKDQFDAKVKQEVQQAYDLGVVDLNVKYTAALDRALETAQNAGKLEDAVAIKGDKEAVALGKGVPAADDEKTPPVVKQLRATYRLAISRLEVERVRRLQPLQAAFAKSLDSLVISLTKEGKLNEAMAVKKHREELAAAPAAPIQSPPSPPSKSTTSKATAQQFDTGWLIGKTWTSDAGTKWSFSEGGVGEKSFGNSKTAFTWRVRSGIVEITGRDGPDSPPRTWYVKFNSETEAMYGNSVKGLTNGLHCK